MEFSRQRTTPVETGAGIGPHIGHTIPANILTIRHNRFYYLCSRVKRIPSSGHVPALSQQTQFDRRQNCFTKFENKNHKKRKAKPGSDWNLLKGSRMVRKFNRILLQNNIYMCMHV